MRASRLFDVRAGEGRVAILGFAVLLLSIITAHTVLETARDALLLTGPGPRALGLVYMAIAACTVPASALAGRAGARFGPRRALAAMLAIAAGAPAVMFAVPASRASAIAVYVLSGVIASVVVPQFWTLVGTVLTVAQGRRLFGFIAAAGVLGGVLGSGAAAAALTAIPLRGLLLLSAGVFALSGLLLARLRLPLAAASVRDGARRSAGAASLRAFRGAPYLLRLALIVVLSTATLLTIDYVFKSTLARTLAPASIGPFVARYYLLLNVLSLAVQLLFGRALVRVLGIAAAVVVTPLLLSIGAGWVLLSGGALAAVLALKGVDGALRHSLHRITDELLYLPVATSVRERVKPLIDGALGRTAQTVTGAGLLGLAEANALRPHLLGVTAAILAAAWLAAALSVRRPYLELLRRSIATGALEALERPDPLDLESAQLLVQKLASDDPLEVTGSMNALARRGRAGFVPALVLLHPDPGVLAAALALFGASSRSDWIPGARRLLADRREEVRMSAARALAVHGALDATPLLADADWRIQGYAALWLALRGKGAVTDDPLVASLRAEVGERGDQARLGLLAAIADAPPSPDLATLLLSLDDSNRGGSSPRLELLARAAGAQGDPRLIPRLIPLLAARAGREEVRRALVALGDRAFDALAAALVDPATPRGVRAHVPKTMARFGTRRAAERLLRFVESERDGLVRYKSIRALGVLVRDHHVALDRSRVEALCRVELIVHCRILARRVALAPAADSTGGDGRTTTEGLLVGLLDDKLRQSLERAFQLLKMAHPREDIHRAYLACRSGDGSTRANAGELLDALLTRRNQQAIRSLLLVLVDDLPARERASRASALIPEARVGSREESLIAMVRDPDPMLAALAGIVARESGDPGLDAAVSEVRRERPAIDWSAGRLLGRSASQGSARA